MKLLIVLFLIASPLISSAQRLTLDECISYALKNHPSLKNTTSTVEIRKQEYEITRKEARPGLNGSLSQTGSLGRNIDPFSNNIVTNAINFNSVGISSSFNIFNGFRQRYEEAVKELAIKGATYERIIQEWNLKRDVTQSYYNHLLNIKATNLKKQQIKDIEVQLSGLSELIREGQLPQTTYDEQLVQKLQEESNLLQLQNNMRNGLIDLTTLMYWDKKDSLMVDTTFTDLQSYTGKANLQRHPVFLKSINEISTNRYSNKLNLIRFQPNVSFNVNLGTTYSSAAPDEFTFFRQLNTNFGQYAGLSVSLPLYNKGQKKHILTTNQLSDIILEQNKDLAMFELKQETRRLQNDLELVDDRIDQLKEQIEVSRRVYAATVEKYKEGIINTLELSQRQASFYQTVLSLKVEEINRTLLLSILNLYK